MVEAYRIGVHLAMTNGVSQVLGVVAREMLGFQRHIDAATAKLGTLRTALIGLGAVTVGGAMLAGVNALVKGGEQMVHQQALLRAAGETNRGIAEATGQAWATAAQVMGTTASGNLRALGELRGLLGSLPEANAVLGQFQQFSRVLGVVTGQNDEGAAGLAARMLDLRGAIRFENGQLDQQRFGGEMDAFMRAVITNRGRVSPRDLLNFMQQAGPAGTMLTPQALYGDMSTLIESMGGLRAGTALTAAYRQLVAGVMPQRQARFLEAAGLLEGGSRTAHRRLHAGGGFEVAPAGEVLLSRGGVRGRDVLMNNPVAWFDRYLVPAMERAGAKTEQQRLDFILKAFSTATGQRFWTQIMLSRAQIDRERANQAAVPADAAARLLAESPVAARQALGAAWENLLTALGSPLVPLAARAMNAVAEAVNSVAQAAARNPALVRTLGYIATGLGAALVALGTVMVGAAALAALGGGGLVAGVLAAGAALGAVTAALMSFSREDWASVGRFFATWGATLYETLIAAPFRWLQAQIAAIDWLLPWRVLTAAVSAGWQAVTDRVDQAVAAITDWSPRLGAAIEGFRTKAAEVISAIVDWIIGLPGRLLGSLEGTGTGGRQEGAPNRNALGGRGAAMVPPPAQPMSYSPWDGSDASTSREAVIRVPVYLDGRVLTEVVTRHQARDLSRPNRSGAGLDSRVALPDAETI
ncbi:hypothetical protein [Roseomonas chloroacetimidivorans]|uniref:hypothetical protein n=1 Tax=Roseomonas chloroacetimidivorans TaxID=1766656 RepID=UPI003C75F7E1